MIPHQMNDSQMFIAGWYMDDTSMCDEIIEFHKNSPDKYEGVSARGVDKTVKDSTDANLGGEVLSKYALNLQTVAEEYIKKYSFCDFYAPWGVISPIIVQQYEPKGGYHQWHCERARTDMPSTTRHLVFMTYLNDVTDDGETEFFYQKLKVKPQKGLTLIWPADWTFTHRGIPSQTQEKYIATGWFNFV